jgi:hypothetical protein
MTPRGRGRILGKKRARLADRAIVSFLTHGSPDGGAATLTFGMLGCDFHCGTA